MYYGQFTKKLHAPDVVKSVRCFGHLIETKGNGSVNIDGEDSQHKTLDEARKYIKNKIFSEKLQEQIFNDIYEEISENRIAQIIKEHHNVKVTDTLIESYIALASSKIFTIDPVAFDIRKLNKLDVVVENKIHYELSDGTIVAIDSATQTNLNNLLHNQTEIVDFMKESKDNFLKVIEQIKE